MEALLKQNNHSFAFASSVSRVIALDKESSCKAGKKMTI
jgi:hypothetical protein